MTPHHTSLHTTTTHYYERAIHQQLTMDPGVFQDYLRAYFLDSGASLGGGASKDGGGGSGGGGCDDDTDMDPRVPLADVQLRVGGKRTFALHRIVLSAAPYFRALLCRTWDPRRPQAKQTKPPLAYATPPRGPQKGTKMVAGGAMAAPATARVLDNHGVPITPKVLVDMDDIPGVSPAGVLAAIGYLCKQQ